MNQPMKIGVAMMMNFNHRLIRINSIIMGKQCSIRFKDSKLENLYDKYEKKI
jgi:hypothetical protein